MSVQNESWDRPICSFCNKEIKYGEKSRHENGICGKIINIKNGPKDKYLYIGRENKHYNQPESVFHNPFVIGKDGTREEVIKKFEEYAPTNKKLIDSLYLLDKEKFIGCYCNFPFEDCHGRILFELREKQKKEQKPIKLAVIGSRGITDKNRIYKVLDKNINRIEMIISGGCPNSPDEIAHEWAKERGKPILIFYPNWKEHGKRAGMLRNESIIRACDKVLAFYDGKSNGTANSIEWAKKLNKPCKIIVFK